MPINISTSPGIFRWRPAAWLRVHGEDAGRFLQGQFTNELRGQRAREARYGLWLTLKGKVLADSFVIAGEGAEEFWVGSYFSSGAVIRERLESHVIADDVTVEDHTEAWAGVAVFGEAAGSLAEPVSKNVFTFAGRRDRAANLECVYRLSDGEPDWGIRGTAAGALREIDAEEVVRRRVRAGIPAIPVDIGPGDLPNEGGLEQDAISYTKGCYLGQEVMARLKSMGQVRRRLSRVASQEAEVPSCPAPLFAGARQVGELRSAVRAQEGGWMGLAMVSLLHVTAATELSLASSGPGSVRLLDAP